MLKSKKIYLDYASSVDTNPSSIHVQGVLAKKKLENARAIVAGILGGEPTEIIFTSGGTESNNLAIQGVLYSAREKIFLRSFRNLSMGRFQSRVPLPARPFENLSHLPHIVTTNIEHPSVLETFKILAKRKLANISIVPVEANGIVDPKKIKKEINKNTLLVSVNYANNEIGTIQPIKEIAKEIRHYRKSQKGNLPFFHTDAVQAGNYLDLNVEKLGVDLLTLSGSKIEGAGKIGVLYKRKSVSLVNVFGGGDQEWGLRPGTENLPEILKFSSALKIVQTIKEKEGERLTKLRDYFIDQLRKISSLVINGDLQNRLPNNINITIPNMPSDLLVIELSAKGIMTSAKSACKSGDGKASYVIEAIRENKKPARNAFSTADAGGETDGSIRFSLGKDTTKGDIDYTIKSLSEILTKLKKWY